MNDTEAREFIGYIFESYKQKRDSHTLDHDMRNIPKNIIKIYIDYVTKAEFSYVIENYKKDYIFNESLVEQNNSYEEQQGLGEVYDFISQFDFSKDYFNLFTTSLLIHLKMYSKCSYPEFGGKLRDHAVYLFDTNYEVVDPIIAQNYFNSLIPRSNEIFEPLERGDIFGYIEKCIIQSVELIKIQPFADGNKRVFRALLNLLLKRIGILPIYIEIQEREIYKKALLKAIQENDYADIINFYYFKICDSIVTLDINRSTIRSI